VHSNKHLTSYCSFFSNGCIHAHPSDQKKVVEILTKDLGVEIRKNPFGSLPYPYQPQGLLSIEQIDN